MVVSTALMRWWEQVGIYFTGYQEMVEAVLKASNTEEVVG